MFRQWLSQWFKDYAKCDSIQSRRRAQPARRSKRLSVEPLEDRTVPSTFMVNELADTHAVNLISGTDATGNISLRSAIEAADHLGGNQTIQFDPKVIAAPQTTTLTAGVLILNDATGDIAIQGPASGVTISGNHASRVFVVGSGTHANFAGLTISDGAVNGNGGGIFNAGTLTLSDCTIAGNAVSLADANWHSALGGGIYNVGNLTLNDCTISGNSAYYCGGGIANGFVGYTYGTLEVTDCTISGNTASTCGGAISNNGTATLTKDTLSGNTAANCGGAIWDTHQLTLRESTISGNTAPKGGGVYITGGITTTFKDSTISENTANWTYDGNGGGIYAVDGTVVLDHCVISRNGSTNSSGGGIENVQATVILRDSTISGNTAGANGGGIDNTGALFLANSTVSDNAAQSCGGGINTGLPVYVEDNSDPVLTNCTISGNTAGASGGGIFIDSGDLVNLCNSTIAENSAVKGGGGIFISVLSNVNLLDCTISANTAGNGGGIYNPVFYGYYGYLTLNNSIVGANSSQAADGDLVGPVLSPSDNNLIGDGTSTSGAVRNNVNGNLVGTHVSPIDPLLAPLADNGGPTQTMALLPGSLAIDAGRNAAIPTGVTTDQRGLPRVVNGAVDIGAVESPVASLPAPIEVTPSGTIAASAGYDIPTFNWSAFAGADHYDLIVVDHNTRMTPIIVQNISGTSYAATKAQALTPGHSFTAYVLAISAADQLGGFATQRFSLAALPAPTGITPSGAVMASAGYDQPTFNWNAVAGADHYTLVVVDNATGAMPIIVRNLSGTSYSATTGQALTPAHNYTVKVYAYSTNSKSYSFGTQSFTLSPLSAPTGISPSGVITASAGYDLPTFNWNVVAGAARYTLVVVDNATGAMPIIVRNLSTASYSSTAAQALTPGHKFTARVYAYSTNSKSYTLGTQSFTLAALSAPTLGPPNGMVAASPSSFIWSQVPGADHYYLYVLDDTTGPVTIRNSNIAASSFSPSVPLMVGHKYTWRVAAVSTNNVVVIWSTSENFTIT